LRLLSVSPGSKKQPGRSLRVPGILAEELPRQPEALVRRLHVMVVLLLGGRRGSLGPLLFRLGWAEVWVLDQRVDVDPLVFPVSQTLPDEDFGSV